MNTEINCLAAELKRYIIEINLFAAICGEYDLRIPIASQRDQFDLIILVH
jgi:hypothetical protein